MFYITNVSCNTLNEFNEVLWELGLLIALTGEPNDQCKQKIYFKCEGQYLDFTRLHIYGHNSRNVIYIGTTITSLYIGDTWFRHIQR